MRFGETPNNQLNIFDNSENQITTPDVPKTKEQVADEVVAAIIADCEKAKQRRSDSGDAITSLKEIEKMVKTGGLVKKPVVVDEEVERRKAEYFKKVYGSAKPELTKKTSNIGEKAKKSSGIVDVKKAQYVD